MIRATVVSKFVAEDGLLRISREREGQKLIALKTFYTVCTPLPENLELFNSLQHHSSAPRKLKYLLQQSPSGAFFSMQSSSATKHLHIHSLLSLLLHIMVFNGV